MQRKHGHVVISAVQVAVADEGVQYVKTMLLTPQRTQDVQWSYENEQDSGASTVTFAFNVFIACVSKLITCFWDFTNLL